MHFVKGLTAAGLLLLASELHVQQAAAQATNRFRILTEISQDLGVSPQQLAACFHSARATLTATQPGAERLKARDAVLLPCLQKANPAITAESFASVIDRYRSTAVTGGS